MVPTSWPMRCPLSEWGSHGTEGKPPVHRDPGFGVAGVCPLGTGTSHSALAPQHVSLLMSRSLSSCCLGAPSPPPGRTLQPDCSGRLSSGQRLCGACVLVGGFWAVCPARVHRLWPSPCLLDARAAPVASGGSMPGICSHTS